jgi:cyanate lyase
VRADGDWPAARQAVLRRMSELGVSVETLARETGLATTTVRYFGQAPAHAGTLEAIGAGLGWPPGYLLRILNGESPRPAGTPVTPETPVMARLTQIERKLDAVLSHLGK